MKKLLAIIVFLGTAGIISAQTVTDTITDENGVQSVVFDNGDTMALDAYIAYTDSVAAAEAAAADAAADEEAEEKPEAIATKDEGAEDDELEGHALIKKYFIDGDPKFMTPILICLILGLALAIERVISLNLATTNSRKLLNGIEAELKAGNVEGAKEICRADRSPSASIFYQGLDRVDEGVEMVEKTIVSYGSVQMSMMERGMIWIALLIALAPMLGFMGTVLGMIDAFDKIQAAGEINPTDVAGGIKVALLTTVFGLIVAIILQIFYNYLISKIDSLVMKMEDGSISLVDMIIKNNVAGK